ncbi:MAG: GH3 auxin-responsive promoter family protein [Cyclobacteriaceae bacterium]|nr:GH3 auxin-responsive promoter family protein [Cyclobacteriaceae bacterium]
MPILGTLLKKGIKLRESLDQEYSSPFDLQKSELRKLLIQARHTEFGKYYHFSDILRSFRHGQGKDFYTQFKEFIPLHNYHQIYSEWWKRSQNNEPDICWPGRVKYFALSSGTSDASSKYIPITRNITKAIQKTSIRQIMTLSRYDFEPKFFERGILMLGGSTHLNKRGHYFDGDLTGIQAANLPFWFQHFYKPGKKIAMQRDWDEKLSEITRSASSWDIGIIVGVPAWVQILMERILAFYNVKNIHEIWPNLKVYVHGGVSFDPYRKGFEKLLGNPLTYIETYLASEGFIAFQAFPNEKSMRMVLNNGLFYEFIPFNEQNIDDHGEIKPGAVSFMIDEVEENTDYALVLSSCAGAWRYIIGDVIKFTNRDNADIVITGRTKHFLSLCGEHLSVDNMNKAIEMVSYDLNIDIKEFTVAGVPHGTLFAHHWYIGTDSPVEEEILRKTLDEHLKKLNDDYRVERTAALKEVIVEVVPVGKFYQYMELKGKSGGQNKFPRVIKNDQFEDWKTFLHNTSV